MTSSRTLAWTLLARKSGKINIPSLNVRVGDFYETFGEDAIKTAKILDIVLTNRANGSSKIELAGFYGIRGAALQSPQTIYTRDA